MLEDDLLLAEELKKKKRLILLALLLLLMVAPMAALPLLEGPLPPPSLIAVAELTPAPAVPASTTQPTVKATATYRLTRVTPTETPRQASTATTNTPVSAQLAPKVTSTATPISLGTPTTAATLTQADGWSVSATPRRQDNLQSTPASLSASTSTAGNADEITIPPAATPPRFDGPELPEPKPEAPTHWEATAIAGSLHVTPMLTKPTAPLTSSIALSTTTLGPPPAGLPTTGRLNGRGFNWLAPGLVLLLLIIGISAFLQHPQVFDKDKM